MLFNLIELEYLIEVDFIKRIQTLQYLLQKLQNFHNSHNKSKINSKTILIPQVFYITKKALTLHINQGKRQFSLDHPIKCDAIDCALRRSWCVCGCDTGPNEQFFSVTSRALLKLYRSGSLCSICLSDCVYCVTQETWYLILKSN